MAKRFADSGTSAVAVATFMGERVCVCVWEGENVREREGRAREEMREGEELGDRVRWRERV